MDYRLCPTLPGQVSLGTPPPGAGQGWHRHFSLFGSSDLLENIAVVNLFLDFVALGLSFYIGGIFVHGATAILWGFFY